MAAGAWGGAGEGYHPTDTLMTPRLRGAKYLNASSLKSMSLSWLPHQSFRRTSSARRPTATRTVRPRHDGPMALRKS